MPKDAALTVRLPLGLKRRLESLARRERRSLSAQIVTCLEQSLETQREEPEQEPARLLDMFEGARVPTDAEFGEVRGLLWGNLGRREPRRRA